jgi:hypothetical protein
VDLNDILRGDARLARMRGKTARDGEAHTFSRSILASAAIRVSRMRLTIHFSPSSGERLSRAERSLGEKSFSPTCTCTEWGRNDVRDVDPLVNATVRLADEVSCVIKELLPKLAQEKIVPDDALRELQLALRRLKVKLDIEFLEELGDRVRILVLLKLDDLDDLADRMPHARAHGCPRAARLRAAREHGRNREVAKDPRRGGLDGVEVGGCEERLEEESTASWVVEVYKEGPVHEPRARVQRSEGLCVRVRMRSGAGERRGASTRVERLAKRVELLECDVPFPREDIRGEFAPVRGGVQVHVGGENAEVVEVVRCARIVPICVLELAKVVQCGYLLEGELQKSGGRSAR